MTVKNRNLKRTLTVISIFLIFVVTFAVATFVIIKIGEAKLKNSLVADEELAISDDFDYSADVYHNGKAYNYNDDIVNILLLGVDKYVAAKDLRGQADAVYLISMNSKTNKIKVYAISRNSITDVDIYDSDGNYFASEKTQLCLAFAYGANGVQGSENCSKAVSKLMYGIPINGYYTVYLDAITDIVNAVGGVTVTLSEDVLQLFPNKKSGDSIVLKGDKAVEYLRVRGESSAPRLDRHKLFINSFISAAKESVAKDLSLPLKMYKKLNNKSITDIELTSSVYMASIAANCDFQVESIKGEYGFDGRYETFEVDKEALYNLVLNDFYIPIS